MLLGLAGGKVGDLVFYRDGGEQRTRTRVIPKNPRSPKQMAQRVRIANVAALYRLLAPVVRESFSNRPSNQSGYNAMASGAIELSPFMTKEMANADSVLPMPAVISKGVLQSLPIIAFDSSAGAPALPVPGVGSQTGDSVAKMSQSILDAYPSLQEGDILTAVVVAFSADNEGGVDIYRGTSSIFSLTLDTSDADATLSDAGFGGSTDVLTIAGASSVTTDKGVYGVALIASRVDANGSLQTSFARLELSAAAKTLYDSYRTDEALSDALKSYTGGSVQLLR